MANGRFGSGDSNALPTLALTFLQFGVGLATFAWPGATQRKRSQAAPAHLFFGRVGFVMGLATMAVRATRACVASGCQGVIGQTVPHPSLKSITEMRILWMAAK
jgi:Eukaryotic cytochrome b561